MIGGTGAFLLALAMNGSATEQGSADSGGEHGPILTDRIRDGWLLSIEGVTRAPIDVGAQIGVETPFGLRVFAGYGWVPQAYIRTITGIAANATGDSRARLVLDAADYSGRTARVVIGLRPFRRLGLYFDAGYARMSLSASREVPDLSIPGVVVPQGGYRATSSLDLWLVELGYQFEFGRRLVIAPGLGFVGTLGARTGIVPTGGAPDDPALLEGAREMDRAFERYGYVPTLSLRLGFDLI